MPANDELTDEKRKELIKEKKRRELKEQLAKSKMLSEQDKNTFKTT